MASLTVSKKLLASINLLSIAPTSPGLPPPVFALQKDNEYDSIEMKDNCHQQLTTTALTFLIQYYY